MTIEESMSKLLRKKNVFVASLIKSRGTKRHMVWKASYCISNTNSNSAASSPYVCAYGATAEEALSKLLNLGKKIAQPK